MGRRDKALKEYNKLVRDRIPEIIRQDGKECGIEEMGEAEFRQALLEKLVEEAEEAAKAAGKPELVKELADVFEVIDAILGACNIPRKTVLTEQARRREARGGFEQRLKLLWVDE